MTIGRLIMFVSKKIIDFIKMCLSFLYKITVIPLKIAVLFILSRLNSLRKLILKTYKTLRRRLHYKHEKRKIGKSASRGFELYANSFKNNKNINRKTAKSIVQTIENDRINSQKTLGKAKEKV